jgi:FAD/FMN-containing dehydrogenase
MQRIFVMDYRYFCGLTGDIVTPNDLAYQTARLEWNRAINKFPLVIVYCNNKNDIRNAIRWAQEKNVQVRIRSGGHNYEGYSVGNGVLVIDISRMKRIRLDAARILLRAALQISKFMTLCHQKVTLFPAEHARL